MSPSTILHHPRSCAGSISSVCGKSDQASSLSNFTLSNSQEVLNNSDHHPVLFLSNLVEGTYTFHLKVTDAKGESDVDRTTVEVKPG